jgi:hypothetical protein
MVTEYHHPCIYILNFNLNLLVWTHIACIASHLNTLPDPRHSRHRYKRPRRPSGVQNRTDRTRSRDIIRPHQKAARTGDNPQPIPFHKIIKNMIMGFRDLWARPLFIRTIPSRTARRSMPLVLRLTIQAFVPFADQMSSERATKRLNARFNGPTTAQNKLTVPSTMTS